LPAEAAAPIAFAQKPIRQQSEELWPVLTRDVADATPPYSSLLPLPRPYVVPGDSLRELYYWDTYFTMLGLAESGRSDPLAAAFRLRDGRAPRFRDCAAECARRAESTVIFGINRAASISTIAGRKTSASTESAPRPFIRCSLAPRARPQAASVAATVERDLLEPGGIIATPVVTGQQWAAQQKEKSAHLLFLFFHDLSKKIATGANFAAEGGVKSLKV
jgi:hypothetical protein